jgi:hypothetical protein
MPWVTGEWVWTPEDIAKDNELRRLYEEWQLVKGTRLEAEREREFTKFVWREYGSKRVD